MKNKGKPSSGSAAKILEAARAEFVQNGLAGARVDRIARRSGINKAMIYYHFGSKENLYQEVISAQLERIASFLEKIIAEGSDPEQFIKQLVGFYDSIFENVRDFSPIFLREAASGGARIRTAFARTLSDKGLIGKLKAIIDEGKRSGQLRNVDSRQAIVSFIGMNLFYLLMAPVINSVWEIKDEKKFRKIRQKEVVDLFLHGIKA